MRFAVYGVNIQCNCVLKASLKDINTWQWIGRGDIRGNRARGGIYRILPFTFQRVFSQLLLIILSHYSSVEYCVSVEMSVRYSLVSAGTARQFQSITDAPEDGNSERWSYAGPTCDLLRDRIK